MSKRTIKSQEIPDVVSHLLHPEPIEYDYAKWMAEALQYVTKTYHELYSKLIPFIKNRYVNQNRKELLRKREYDLEGRTIEVWRHAARVAIGSLMVASKLNEIYEKDVLIIGGLHDVPEDSWWGNYPKLRTKYETKIKGAHVIHDIKDIWGELQYYRDEVFELIGSDLTENFPDGNGLNIDFISRHVSYLTFLEARFKGTDQEKKELKSRIVQQTYQYLHKNVQPLEADFYGFIKLLDRHDGIYTNSPDEAGVKKALEKQNLSNLLVTLIQKHATRFNPGNNKTYFAGDIIKILGEIKKLTSPRKIYSRMHINNQKSHIIKPQTLTPPVQKSINS